MAAIEISADEARLLWLQAQGLLGPRISGGVQGVVRHLGGVQLDTISVLARSHELVPYSRLGAVGRAAVERGLWGGGAFEYWAHAACVLPIESWPLFAARRRRAEAASRDRVNSPSLEEELIAAIRERGPMTARELGGARAGGTWWSWSPVKRELEHLFSLGILACVTRRGFQRVYDLSERAIPAEFRDRAMTDEECFTAVTRIALRGFGVATARDIPDYYWMKVASSRRGLAAAGAVQVRVRGWADSAYALPETLEQLGSLRGLRHHTTLLTPFDNLLWSRNRAERVFGLRLRLESYTPAPQRVHGYYAMPLLAGGKLAGRVDPARAGRTLVGRRVSMDKPSVAPAMAKALAGAAAWVGCDSVSVEVIEDAACADALAAELRRLGLA